MLIIASIIINQSYTPHYDALMKQSISKCKLCIVFIVIMFDFDCCYST